MKVYPGLLNGFIRPPSSKSVTHRALILSACSEKGSIIKNPLLADDTLSTKRGLERLGSRFRQLRDAMNIFELIDPIDREDSQTTSIHCNNSGTSLRLLSGICGLLPRESKLFGDESLNRRPMKQLIQALNHLGIESNATDGNPPITIRGPPNDKVTEVNIAGNISSQFISSLMIQSALREDKEITISIEEPIVSKPYIDLTKQMLESIGVLIEEADNQYTIQGIKQFQKFEYQIPMDYSSAAFFIAGGAFPDNRVVIDGIDNDLPQADFRILEIIQQMGAKVSIQSSNFTKRILIEGSELKGMNVDLSASPDLFPIVSVLGLIASGETKITGAHHLKYKESDRIHAMTEVIKSLGGKIEPTDDGAIIQHSELIGGTVNSFNDHRIAMAAAIAASRCKKPVEIENSDCIDVSYPSFFVDLNRLH